MNTYLHKALILLTGMVVTAPVPGQTGWNEMDSISISKPKVNQNLYRFSDRGAREMQFQGHAPILVHYKADPRLRDVGNGVLTAITGIGFSTSTEVNWETTGILQCNDSLPAWSIILYCEGVHEKNRERVRDDDGSWSVETEVTNEYFWDKDASGIILEGRDTIGFFLIRMNPWDDKELGVWNSTVFPPEPQKETRNSKVHWSASWIPEPGRAFGISGIFRGEDFACISNGLDHKQWIFMNASIAGMFRCDIDFRGIGKKYRIMPYLLIPKGTPVNDRHDIYRLAMLCRLLNNYLGR